MVTKKVITKSKYSVVGTWLPISIEVVVRLHKRAKSIRRRFEPFYLDQAAYKLIADMRLNESSCENLCFRQPDVLVTYQLCRGFRVFTTKIQQTQVYPLSPNVTSWKVSGGTSVTDMDRWCYKLSYLNQIPSLFTCFFCWIYNKLLYWKGNIFIKGCSQAVRQRTLTPSSVSSNLAIPATLPISLMVKRSALTRHTEVRYLDGQPKVDFLSVDSNRILNEVELMLVSWPYLFQQKQKGTAPWELSAMQSTIISENWKAANKVFFPQAV